MCTTVEEYSKKSNSISSAYDDFNSKPSDTSAVLNSANSAAKDILSGTASSSSNNSSVLSAFQQFNANSSQAVELTNEGNRAARSIIDDATGKRSNSAETKTTPGANEENKTNTVDKETTSAESNSGQTEVESFVSPLNPTDPVVWIDPKFKAKTIVEMRETDKADTSDEEDIITGYEQTIQRDQSTEKVSGKFVPVILLNNYKIELSNIGYFKLSYTGFSPTLELEINDPDSKIQSNDVPGLNNNVTIAIVPTVEGVYRTIKLDFYITNYEPFGRTTYRYMCKWKFMPFEQTYTKAVTYPGSSTKITLERGADGKSYPVNLSAPSQQTPTPNTWEFLHTIALETGLGFQSTDKCMEIADYRERILQGENYATAIKRYVEIGGLDENSIFDCFIDLYNYITLINLSYIFNSSTNKVDPKTGESTTGLPTYNWQHYTIYTFRGSNNTDDNLEGPNAIKTNRSITNNKSNANHSNLQFSSDKYTFNTDTRTAINVGTLVNYYYVQPEGIGNGINSISTHQVQIQESSTEGTATDEYEFAKCEFLGFDMSETPSLLQKKYHEALITKLNANTLTLQLDEVNLGIQRGTVLQVHIWEYLPEQKRKILQNHSSLWMKDLEPDDAKLADDISGDPNDIEFDDSIEDVIMNDTLGIPNFALSGMYYVNGMIFEYNENEQRIKQTLQLIKQGSKYSNNNKFVLPRANIPVDY